MPIRMLFTIRKRLDVSIMIIIKFAPSPLRPFVLSRFRAFVPSCLRPFALSCLLGIAMTGHAQRAEMNFPNVTSIFSSDAEGRPVLTLGACLKQALESNYSITIARNLEEAARNNLTPGPFLPSLTLNGRQNQDRLNLRDVYPEGSDPSELKREYATNLYSTDLSLNWRLFDGMSMFATYDAKKELLGQGELNLRRSMEDLAADIAGQYYYIVTQENLLKATKLYLDISGFRNYIAIIKHEAGAFSGVERRQAQLDLNADSSRFVRQSEILDNAYVKLFEMMNVALETRAFLGDSIVTNGSLQLNDLCASAKERNTAILMARSGERISALDLRIARSSRYPTLDFTAGYRFNHSSSGIQAPRFSELYGANWGFTASIKLFDRLETNRKIKNALIDVDNSELRSRQTEWRVISEITQSYNTYRKNFQMIEAERKSVNIATDNLDAAMAMYREGAIGGIEFREIQRTYLGAWERLFNAINQAKYSEIQLLYLAGRVLD